MLGDAEDGPSSTRYSWIEVPDVGRVRARKPMPNAIPAMAMAANAKIDAQAQTDYVVLFVRNHLDEGELERIYYEMITGDMPRDALTLIAREIATWGTARPTRPSSRCA